MLEVAPGTQPKYKRRKVFAIREFPRGCGPNAVQLKPKSSQEASVVVRLENGAVPNSDALLGASNVGKEHVALPSVLQGVDEEVIASSGGFLPGVTDLTNSLLSVGLENDVGSSSEMAVTLEVRQLAKESLDSSKMQNGHFYSMIYGLLKRRKISAIREFPPGCGPSACFNSTDGHQRVVSASSLLKGSNVVGVNIDEANKQLGDGSVWVASAETADGEQKKPLSMQQEMAGGSLVIASNKNASSLKQSILVERSADIANANKILDDEKSVVKQVTAAEGSVQFKSAGKVGVEKRNDSTVTKRKDIIVDVQMKPASKSELERISKEKNVDKNLVRSSYNKNLDGRKVENASAVQVTTSKSGLTGILVGSNSNVALGGRKISGLGKNLQIKANDSTPSRLVVNSPCGTTVVDKEGGFLAKKTYVNDKSSTTIVKRKLSEGNMYKNRSQEERDDQLESYAERRIILALKAADDCPWSNPKKRRAINSNSVVLKSNMNREKRLHGKNLVSMVPSSSQLRYKGLVENDDDMLQEDGDNKALVVYQAPNELTTTMNPFVAPKSRHKDKALVVRQKPNELSIIMTPFVPPELNQNSGGVNEEVEARNKVKRALRLFQLVCRKLLQGEESRSKRLGKINRIDLQASSMLKEKGEWLGPGDAIIGHVPGVQIGDEFHYRVELSMVGLHRPFQAGIDSAKKNGMVVATSIVASAGYQDDMDSDVLIYSGSGGNSAVGDKQAEDQKLERGNLGLRNCIHSQTPVRVIYGFKEKGSDPHDSKGRLVTTFTYDGLYHVISYWQEIGPHGFNVFKFQLKRIAGQPELALKELKRSAELKKREGFFIKDISNGKEKVPICGVNIINTDQPMPFNYITKNIYPSWYEIMPPRGCDCIDGCSDSENCACAVKNGGEIPFNYNGAIVQAKPLIYECGPSCKCPSSCHNRVSQHGVRIPLEIFKTEGRGWGVRSLKSIPSGSFICEYIGELLQDGDAEQRANDEYLFDIGHNYDDQSLWHDLPNLIPDLQSSSACDTVENVGFTIDASEYGNIGRFINHSCSPNLYAQNVLYDHDDKRVPHIMFFAVDNIPPLQELTYHYNYTVGQVRDSEGNVKQKPCCCGSPECCGWLY